jgi:hypothetical protein
MGFDLIGHGGASFGWDEWRSCLALAQTFGWRPEGTIAPPHYEHDWDGSYLSNDLQEVTDTDARALGAALYRAVAAIEAGQTLSEEQETMLKNCWNVSRIRGLADYAIMGHFAIM